MGEHVSIPHAMAPKAMAMKAAAMTKGALADALTTEDVKKKHIVKALATLAEIGAAEVKKNGIFVIPGLCRIKTRVKPATKAGKRQIVKAKPAKTVVKAFPVAALKAAV